MVKLTDKEALILKYCQKGKSAREIAGIVNISIHSVQALMNSIYHKCGNDAVILLTTP